MGHLSVFTKRLGAELMAGSLLLAASHAQEAPRPVEWLHLSSTRGEVPMPSGGTQQTARQVLDVDGLNDIVLTERTQAPSVVWLRRSAEGWTKYVIDDTPQRIEAGGGAHDIDGDGDLDLVFGGDSRDHHVWWWENPGRIADAWPRHVIGAPLNNMAAVHGFDGDGDLDVISVGWYNP